MPDHPPPTQPERPARTRRVRVQSVFWERSFLQFAHLRCPLPKMKPEVARGSRTRGSGKGEGTPKGRYEFPSPMVPPTTRGSTYFRIRLLLPCVVRITFLGLPDGAGHPPDRPYPVTIARRGPGGPGRGSSSVYRLLSVGALWRPGGNRALLGIMPNHLDLILNHLRKRVH